jgi:hypothetical protein
MAPQPPYIDTDLLQTPHAAPLGASPSFSARFREAFADELCDYRPVCSNPFCLTPYRREQPVPEHPQSAHLPSGFVPDCDCPEDWEIGE